jgi:hypothetical protein
MDIEEKAKYIDDILGFYFDEPFLEAAKHFPSPESEVESWFKFARVFEKVCKLGNIQEEEKEALQLLIEDATTEYESSMFIGEEPDKDYELGVGYDGYEIPKDFDKKHHKLIWQEVLNVYSS